jgi:oxygen-independent coproporphyrinogen-3 oxidase
LRKAGLYIHFPFCRRACFYCHFFKRRHRPARLDGYLAGLERELLLRHDPGLAVDTVYFGGGSPSLLDAGHVSRLLEAAAKRFGLSPRAEVTLEANPEDLSPPRLRGLQAVGVNRLSIGAQSFQERDLRFLKRTHGAAMAARAVAMARDAGFGNVSIDLIVGLTSQTRKSMESNFRVVEALAPDHVSVYILENVPRPGAESRDARHYHQARQSLLVLGFEHYEVSNFCKPGKASRHNLKYWRMEPYVGLGPSAAGYLDGMDYRNVSDLNKYGAAVGSGKLPHVRTKQLDPDKRRIITGLRLHEGIPSSSFSSFPAETGLLLREGFLVRRGANIAVPPEKILLMNEILGYFI